MKRAPIKPVVKQNRVNESATPHVVKALAPILKQKLAGVDPITGAKLVSDEIDRYFQNEGWSLDKEEWERRMSPEQRLQLANMLYFKLNPGRGPGRTQDTARNNPQDSNENEEVCTCGVCPQCRASGFTNDQEESPREIGYRDGLSGHSLDPLATFPDRDERQQYISGLRDGQLERTADGGRAASDIGGKPRNPYNNNF